MNIVIFGATGRTGHHLVSQALDHGHEVTAIARDPARLHQQHQRLRATRAELTDPAAIKPALDGADAVISALGSRSRSDRVCTTAMGSIATAMTAAGTRRVIAICAALVASADPAETLPTG